ncbi:MAG: hypothetical protein ABIA97_04000 [Candidatus Omnitrophota bacterium]
MKYLIILIIVIIVIGVAIMSIFYNANKVEFVKHSPKDPLMDLTFEYPQGWGIFERRGAYGVFIQAQILEDLKAAGKDKATACSIDITIYPKSKAEFSPLSAQGLAEDIKKKRLSLKGSKLVSSSDIMVAGLRATDDKLAYSIFKVPLQANAKPIHIIERIICFQKGDNFYTVRMEEGTETFKDYDKIFNRVLEAIQFKS